MFIQPPERILILVDRLHRDFCYWDKLVFEQDNGLMDVSICDAEYCQIQGRVINNVKRGDFVNGELNNDQIEYMVLGIGGAALSLEFPNCDHSSSIELKFSDVANNDGIQIWGAAPMKRNLNRVVYLRKGVAQCRMLRVILDELKGDHNQVLQLCAARQQEKSNDANNVNVNVKLDDPLATKE